MYSIFFIIYRVYFRLFFRVYLKSDACNLHPMNFLQYCIKLLQPNYYTSFTP